MASQAAIAAARARIASRERSAPPTLREAGCIPDRNIDWRHWHKPGRCRACERKDVLLVYSVRPIRVGGDRWSIIAARCVDHGSCFEVQQARRAKASRRTGLFILEQPKAPDASPPFCRWCGEEIVLVEPVDYRRRTRNYHRGDEFEVGDFNCGAAYSRARTYEPRVAVFHREVEAHGVLACVDCGVVCAEPNPDSRFPTMNLAMAIEVTRWEADHDVPLEDGGPHTLDNLRCRCCPCHRAKTAAENRARAAKRRVDKAQPRT